MSRWELTSKSEEAVRSLGPLNVYISFHFLQSFVLEILKRFLKSLSVLSSHLRGSEEPEYVRGWPGGRMLG